MLLRPLVERLAHDPEVRLRRERAAVALGRRAVGHVVEQALGGRADHRDDVPAGFGDREAVDDVLVHVPGRGQHVAQRRRALAEALAQLAALAHAPGDLGDAALALLRDPRPDRTVLRARQRAQVESPRVDGLGDLLGRAALVVEQRVAQPVADAQPELAAVGDVVDEHVRQRRVELVHAVHAEQSRDRALDRDGRLAGDLLAYLLGDLGRRLPAGGDHAGVEVEL